MDLEQTVQSLKTLGIDRTVLESGGDGAILVMPEYGRVLGLWPHWRGENALWVNPDFVRRLGFGAKDEGWLNPGGDRVWLGPEREFFMEDDARPDETFFVPPALDPGAFNRVNDRTGCAMENRGEVLAWRSNTRLAFRIIRRIRPMPGPELNEISEAPWMPQAGYEEETSLEASFDLPVRVWLWNLTQVPGLGEVRLPLLREDSQVVPLAGAVPVRVRLTAEEVADRILWTSDREAGRAVLVLRRFEKLDGADPEQRAVECRFEPVLGCGELSCVSRALGPVRRGRLSWKTSLCAFTGRRDEILALADRLSHLSR